MKVELRNIKHFKSLSEETLACQASLYVDGRKVGELENTGKGEGMYPRYSEPGMREKLEAWAKTLPPIKTQYGDLPMYLDLYLADLVAKDLAKKEAARLFKNRICLTDEQGGLYTTRVLAADVIAAVHAGTRPMKLRAGERILKTVEEVAALM